jgi:hypothetical protein
MIIMAHTSVARPAPARCWAAAVVRAARSLLIALALVFVSCQSSDPVTAEKQRTLSPDERYLVEYYMNILKFEKEQFDSPATREEKRKELESAYDAERIRNVIAELEKKPERWLAIYNRINELQTRELQQPTERY